VPAARVTSSGLNPSVQAGGRAEAQGRRLDARRKYSEIGRGLMARARSSVATVKLYTLGTEVSGCAEVSDHQQLVNNDQEFARP